MKTVSSKSQLHESYSSGWEWANLQRLPKICARDMISDILKMITELSAIPPFQLDPRVNFSLKESFIKDGSELIVENEILNQNFTLVCLYSIIINNIISNDSKISHDSKKITPFYGVENSDFSDVKSSELDSEQTGFLDGSIKASKVCLNHLVPSERYILDLWALEASCLIASLLGATIDSKDKNFYHNNHRGYRDSDDYISQNSQHNTSGSSEESFIEKLLKTKSDSSSKVPKSGLLTDPKSYLLIQSFVSVDLPRLFFDIKYFSKTVLSIRCLQNLKKFSGNCKFKVESYQNLFIKRNFINLQICQRIIAHNLLKFHTKPLDPFKNKMDSVNSTNTDIGIEVLNNQSLVKKNNFSVFSQWWISTLSVAVNEIISSSKKIEKSFHESVLMKSTYNDSCNKSFDSSHQPCQREIFRLPSLSCLDYISGNSKSVTLAFHTANSLLELLPLVQYNEQILNSLTFIEIPEQLKKNKIEMIFDNFKLKNKYSTLSIEDYSSILTSKSLYEYSTISQIKKPFNTKINVSHNTQGYGDNPVINDKIQFSSATKLLTLFLFNIHQIKAPKKNADLFQPNSILYNHLNILPSLMSKTESPTKEGLSKIILEEYIYSSTCWKFLSSNVHSFLQKIINTKPGWLSATSNIYVSVLIGTGLVNSFQQEVNPLRFIKNNILANSIESIVNLHKSRNFKFINDCTKLIEILFNSKQELIFEVARLDENIYEYQNILSDSLKSNIHYSPLSILTQSLSFSLGYNICDHSKTNLKENYSRLQSSLYAGILGIGVSGTDSGNFGFLFTYNQDNLLSPDSNLEFKSSMPPKLTLNPFDICILENNFAESSSIDDLFAAIHDLSGKQNENTRVVFRGRNLFTASLQHNLSKKRKELFRYTISFPN
ncbi:hypothetical protein AYI70_g4164 [Smittium culicis]|uniref:Uncharacterized protein n=1 Tax=Smittium culicis TaxID=133412 RepID=A0A1R1Y0X2_9FUNG|nr:hypothetical protein AYI70_g4164 [Smittium culicis]